MRDEAQSPDELQAHYGPDGPVQPALDWFEAVLERGDYGAAWSLMTPTLRLVSVQAWLYNNREHPLVAAEYDSDRDALAGALADDPPGHDLWRVFGRMELEDARGAWPGISVSQLGVPSYPRPVGPGLELIHFLDTGGEELVFEGPTPVATVATFTMEHLDGRWLVASFSDQLPDPGWPPTIR